MDLTDEQWAIVAPCIIHRLRPISGDTNQFHYDVEFCTDTQGRQANTPEQRFSVAIAHHQLIPPTFLRFPTISFIDMEFCTDPARTIHGANMDSA